MAPGERDSGSRMGFGPRCVYCSAILVRFAVVSGGTMDTRAELLQRVRDDAVAIADLVD